MNWKLLSNPTIFLGVAFSLALIILMAGPCNARNYKGLSLSEKRRQVRLLQKYPPKPAPQAPPESSANEPSTKSEANSQFIFAEETDFERFERDRLNLKPWTAYDKETVEAELNAIASKYPTLISNAALNGKIWFCRTGVIRPNSKVIAMTLLSCITISDAAFGYSEKSLRGTLIHELVHLADYSHHISYSKDFVEFAQPTVCTIRHRLRVQGYKRVERECDLEQRIGTWGSDSLTEALAEHFAIKWSKEQTADQNEQEGRISNRLLHPSEDDIRFSKHMFAAKRELMSHGLASAIREADIAISIDPSAPTPWSTKAMCASMQRDFENAEKAASESIRLMDAAGVAPDDPQRAESLVVKAGAVKKLRGSKEALPILNAILDVWPDEKLALFYRSQCLAESNKFGASALDRYNSDNDVGVFLYSLKGFGGNEVNVEVYDKALNGSSKAGLCLQKRAFSFEYLADNEKDPETQRMLYEKSLADYQQSILYNDAPIRDGLFGCCRVNLRLKRFKDADRNHRDLVRFDTDPLPAQILNIDILEARGHTKAARRQYQRVTREISLRWYEDHKKRNLREPQIDRLPDGTA